MISYALMLPVGMPGMALRINANAKTLLSV